MFDTNESLQQLESIPFHLKQKEYSEVISLLNKCKHNHENSALILEYVDAIIARSPSDTERQAARAIGIEVCENQIKKNPTKELWLLAFMDPWSDPKKKLERYHLGKNVEQEKIEQEKKQRHEANVKKVIEENLRSAEELCKKGREAFEDEKYLNAIEFYEHAVNKNPELAQAYFGMIECYIGQAVTRKNKDHLKKFCQKAEEIFKQGMGKFRETTVVPADVYWSLGQAKEGQGDLDGSEQYYAKAFQGDRDKFCARYLELAEKAMPDVNMLMRNKFIRGNEEFDAYFQSRYYLGEKVVIYCRNARVYIEKKEYISAIQQLLLAFAYSATQAQDDLIFNLIEAIKEYFSLDVSQNIAQEILPKELASLKEGYIEWIRQCLTRQRYQEGVKKYDLVKDAVAFSELLTEDFRADIDNARAQIEQKKLLVKENIEFSKGDVQFKAGHYEAALEHYNKVIEMNSQRGLAYISVGKCYRKLGEAKMPSPRFKLPAQIDSINEVKILFSEGEEKLYQQADHSFTAGMNFLTEPAEMAEAYTELGYLCDLRCQYNEAIDYFLKSFNLDKDKFCKFYIKLIESDFNKKAYSVSVVYRFACVFHHESFQEYNSRKSFNANGNYMSNLHYMCAAVYHDFLMFEASIQQYLLALFHSKTADQTDLIYNDLRQELLNWSRYRGSISDTIFGNIFGLTTDKELHDIKVAYIQWIKHDLAQGNYDVAIKKFTLIGQDVSSHELMDAEFFSQIGSACDAMGDAGLAAFCYQTANDLLGAEKSVDSSLCGRASPGLYADKPNDHVLREGINLSNN